MTLKQYNWKDGPDVIQQHSVAKHRILQSYLSAYFKTLISSPRQDVMRLTLVDGSPSANMRETPASSKLMSKGRRGYDG